MNVLKSYFEWFDVFCNLIFLMFERKKDSAPSDRLESDTNREIKV